MLGSFGLSMHLLMTIIAAMVVGVGGRIRSRHEYPNPSFNFSVNLIFYLFCGVLSGALLGATLPYLVMSWFGHPLPPYWYMGWQNWFGAVTGGSLAGLLFCRRYQCPVGRSFDFVAPLLPVALAIVRIGCQLAGDSQGKLTTHWPAMVLPDTHGVWASRYPTQIVDIFINLLIAGFLLGLERWIARRKSPGWPFAGFLFWLYILLFCTLRIYFEFWRADTLVLVAPFTWNHLYCVIGLVLAGVGMVRGMRKAGMSLRVHRIPKTPQDM
jgi:phosphatidylglycerol:prolipoprotein diacylglycerol transferase